METNLVLASGNPAEYVDLVDEALLGLMIDKGINIAPAGSREIDYALSETAWSDDERGTASVRLMQDGSIPAQWIAVSATDESIMHSIASRLADALPVLPYETLLDEATSRPGGLTRLAVTHDARLSQHLPALVAQGLSDQDATKREDAVMAAQLAGAPALVQLLERAVGTETDAGVAAMLRQAIRQLVSGGAKQ